MEQNFHQKLSSLYRNRLLSSILFFALFIALAVWNIFARRNMVTPLLYNFLLMGISLLLSLIVEYLWRKFTPMHIHRYAYLVQLVLIFAILAFIALTTNFQGEHIPSAICLSVLSADAFLDIILLIADLGMVMRHECLQFDGIVVQTKRGKFKTIRNRSNGELITFKKVELAENIHYRIYYYPHSKIMVFEQLPDEVSMYENSDIEVEDVPHPLDDIDPDAFTPPVQPVDITVPPVSKIKKRLIIIGSVGIDLVAGVLGLLLGQQFWYALIPLIFGEIFLFAHLQDKEKRARCTRRMEGVIVDIVRRRSGKSTSYYPVIEYHVGQKTYRFEGNIGTPSWSQGEIVPIYFNPNDPTDVMQASNATAVVTLVIALIALIIGVGMILFNLYDVGMRNTTPQTPEVIAFCRSIFHIK